MYDKSIDKEKLFLKYFFFIPAGRSTPAGPPFSYFSFNGFYVYAKPNLSDTQTVVKYISRYLVRPVIALSRIDSYDGENVTFHYNRHEDNVFVKKTIPALDFISLLIQHIPEPHYKMTRYYGLYARHRDNDKKLRKAIHQSKHKFILSYSKWRNNIAASFGYDPLCCSKCKATMTLTEFLWKKCTKGP